jgi:hypothetical protein
MGNAETDIYLEPYCREGNAVRLMRSLVAAALVIAMTLAMAAQVLAAPTVTVTANGRRVSATPASIYIDGVKLDAEAFVIGGRTLAPFRAIFEALGAVVDWDSATETAKGTKGTLVIRLQIGNPTAYVGDASQQLQVPAMYINGRTYAPVRFVVEALGGKLEWDPVNSRVDIASNGGAAPTTPPVTVTITMGSFFGAPTIGASYTRHEGTIKPGGEVWGPGDHLVVGTFNVKAGGDSTTTPYLDIQAGARVFFTQDGGIWVGFGGAGGIRINGTPENPVQLAANASNPQPGFWNGIQIHPGVTNDSAINGASIWHAGDANWGALQVWGNEKPISITVQNTAFVNCRTYAVHLIQDGSLTRDSRNLTIIGTAAGNDANTGYPFCTREKGVSTLPLGDYHGNKVNAVLLYSSRFSNTATLRNIGIPYLVNSAITVDNGATLVVEPGVKCLFNNDQCNLVVGCQTPGRLVADANLNVEGEHFEWESLDKDNYATQLHDGLALTYAAMEPYYQGTPAGKNPAIIFAPVDKNAGRGAWDGVELYSCTSPDTIIRGVYLHNGGSSRGAISSGIWAQSSATEPANGNFTLAYSIVGGSAGTGMKFAGPVKLSKESVGNTFEDNSELIRLDDGNSLGSFIPGWQFANNDVNLITVTGPTSVTRSMTIRNMCVPIRFMGNVTVGGPDRPTLTIAAGTQLEFAPGVGLSVGEGESGVLDVQGSEDNPVKMSGANGEEWAGITLGINAKGSSIVDTIVDGALTGVKFLGDGVATVAGCLFHACKSAVMLGFSLLRAVAEVFATAFFAAGNAVVECGTDIVGLFTD